MKIQVWIYWLLKCGNPVYVGQSAFPATRATCHKRGVHGHLGDAVKGCEFKTIRETNHKNSRRIEMQIIRALTAKGFNLLNKQRNDRPKTKVFPNAVFGVKDNRTGKVYKSMIDAVRHGAESKRGLKLSLDNRDGNFSYVKHL